MQMGIICPTEYGTLLTDLTSQYATEPVHTTRRKRLADLDLAHKTCWISMEGSLRSEDVHGIKPSGHGSVDDGSVGKPYWIAWTLAGFLGYVEVGGRCCHGWFGLEVASNQYEVSFACCPATPT